MGSLWNSRLEEPGILQTRVCCHCSYLGNSGRGHMTVYKAGLDGSAGDRIMAPLSLPIRTLSVTILMGTREHNSFRLKLVLICLDKLEFP